MNDFTLAIVSFKSCISLPQNNEPGVVPGVVVVVVVVFIWGVGADVQFFLHGKSCCNDHMG